MPEPEAAKAEPKNEIATTMSAEQIERELAKTQGKDLSPGRGALQLASQGVVLTNLQDAWRFAELMHSTGLAPNSLDTPAKILLAMQMGMEVGLPPAAAIQNTAVVNGRPSLYGDICLGLVRSSKFWVESGFAEQWVYDGNGKPEKAISQMQRAGGQPQTREFTWQDAITAGLTGKDNWKKYPKAMLMWRARWQNLSALFSDVLKGVVPPEIAQDLPERNITPATTSTKPSNLDELAEQLQASQEMLDEKKAAETQPETSASPTQPTPAEELRAAAASTISPAAANGEADALDAVRQSIRDCKYPSDVEKLRGVWCGDGSKLTDSQKFEIGALCDARRTELKNAKGKKSASDQGSLV